MTSPTPTPPDVIGPWRLRSDELAAWALRTLVNRRDAFGRYIDVERRTDPARKSWTDKSGLTEKKLVQHFAGACTGNVLGLHTTYVDEAGICTSRWVLIDIDRHDDSVSPEATLRGAMAIHAAAAALGFRPLLTDSNGDGGYHVLVVLDGPTPTGDVYRFGLWLVRDWKSWGLIAAPETFPKQASIKPGKFGNWPRLPGRHHTRDHWSKVWDGSRWLEGAEAVAAILSVEGSPASLIPAEATSGPKAKAPRAEVEPGPKPGAAEDRVGKWARAAFHSEVGKVASCSRDRNIQLNESAFALGKLVGGKFLDRDEVARALYNAAIAAGLGEGETVATIASGLDSGELVPSDGPKERGAAKIDSAGARTGKSRPRHASPPGPGKKSFGKGGSPPAPTDGDVPEEGDSSPFIPWDQEDDPDRLARLFLDRRHTYRVGGDIADRLTLRFYQGGFHEWIAGAYRDVPDAELHAAVWQVVKDEFDRLHAEKLEGWHERVAAAKGRGDEQMPDPPKLRQVKSQLIANVIRATQAITVVSERAVGTLPAWIGATDPHTAAECLPCRNGVVHLPSLVSGSPGAFMPPDPCFFTPYALDLDFDPAAPEPVNWLTFLGARPLMADGDIKLQVWPGAQERENIAFLQEWIGYNLVADTSQQKIALFVGETRSGKGTIARVMKRLIGAENCVGPTVSGLAAQPFGLEQLLGKLAAIISDARFNNREAVGIFIEILLAISGEDAITVQRKNRGAVTLKLPIRFTLISNESPKLTDASGAIVNRLLVYRFKESFLGKEDGGLMEKLEPEMPGILLWAIEGWRRLRDRGRFVQPEDGLNLFCELAESASDIKTFVADECRLVPDAETPVDDLFHRWLWWCSRRNKRFKGDHASFGKNLRAAIPRLDRAKAKKTPKEELAADPAARTYIRSYVGIELNFNGEADSWNSPARSGDEGD